MQRIWSFVLEPWVLAVTGLVCLAATLWLGADLLHLGAAWVVVCAVVAGGLAVGWAWRRRRASQAGHGLSQALQADASAARANATPAQRDELAVLRERMGEAIQRIKTSRLGQTAGAEALYELPWYAIIGNPAAGKSSAVVKSGLRFPFAEPSDNVVQGVGGTRHCDWYFTHEGILLDTAGRYTVHEEDRAEWLGFLRLLKKHRPKAPLNGVIIAVSLAELGTRPSDFAIDLARQLRQRVQELTETLAVFMPVYVVFTKADLIAGFVDFFEDRDRQERDKVWGATLPCQPGLALAAGARGEGATDAVDLFEHHFDVLYEGLKAASVARMSMHRGEQLAPGVLTFPLEFAALKPVLRTFVNALFEDNPYQFSPIFRGFYFTSAVQEGQSTSRASQRVAAQFSLQLQQGTAATVYAHSGFFLKELFSKVIFADRQLVQQYTSRRQLQLRWASFAVSLILLAGLLAAWTWSYVGNQTLVAHVLADLARAQQVQSQRTDLASRLEALEILQDRLAQTQRHRVSRPGSVGWGLYQGEAIEARLKEEYFVGLQAVLLQPAAQAMAQYLGEVNARASALRPVPRPDATMAANPPPDQGPALWPATAPAFEPASVPVAAPAPAPASAPTSTASAASAAALAASPYAAPLSTDVTEAYNALKAYLMLGDRTRLEPGHMGDQLTRFWRGWLEAQRGAMPREQMVQHAERILSFALTQMADPAFPEQALDLAMLDQTREQLRHVIKGMPARERVYAEIKARAATRFAPVTVAALVGEADRQVLAGSQVVSGAFTRQAWEGQVKDAIRKAAQGELRAVDWVLKTTHTDDLTLEGSPEQIQKALLQRYKADYAQAWLAFVQGVNVQTFGGFEPSLRHLTRLADPAQSPLVAVIRTVHEQTAWDLGAGGSERLAPGQRGVIEWFQQVVLGQVPPALAAPLETGWAPTDAAALGPIAQAFGGLARWMTPRDNAPALVQRYTEALGKVRGRFQQIQAQGDGGPAASQWMAQTLDGRGELTEALKLVDEQMLVGLPEGSKAALRPLLVRPLVQAFAAVVPPAEAELNRLWLAQVYAPYQRNLATKYPFDPSSRLEATPAEIAQVFGADGAVAKYLTLGLGPLVTQRGDALSARTWADVGLRLRPAFATGVPAWVAATGERGGMASEGHGAAPEAQTIFQVLPLASPGLSEYTLEVDGQTLRYRNGQANWAPFVWPGPGTPGGRITAVRADGTPLEVFHEPGRYALEKMINAAQRKRLEAQLFELHWGPAGAQVGVQLRIVANAAAQAHATVRAMPSGAGAPGAATGRPAALPAVVVGPASADISPGAGGAPPAVDAAPGALAAATGGGR